MSEIGTPLTSRRFVSVGTPVDIAPMNARVDDPDNASLTLRVGARFVKLGRGSAAAWASATVPATTGALAAAAGDATQVQELISAGLLVPMPSSESVASWTEEPFFGLLPLPLSRILDSSPDERGGRWTVGDWSGAPLVRLRALDHLIWSQLNGRTSISDAILAAAEATGNEPESLVAGSVGLLEALLSARAVALDAR